MSNLHFQFTKDSLRSSRLEDSNEFLICYANGEFIPSQGELWQLGVPVDERVNQLLSMRSPDEGNNMNKKIFEE